MAAAAERVPLPASWGALLLSVGCVLARDISYLGSSLSLQPSSRERQTQEDTSFLTLRNMIASRPKGNPIVTRIKTVAIPVIYQYAHPGNVSEAYDTPPGPADRTFGNFSFKIQFSKANARGIGSGSAPLQTSIEAGVYDQLYISVTAVSNLTDVILVVSSCQLRDSEARSSSGTYIIQGGCADNKTAKEVNNGDSKEMVFSLNLSWVTAASTAPQVFIMCEVKLCRSLNWSQSCPSRCSPSYNIDGPFSMLLETSMHRVSSGLIRITKDTPSDFSNYRAVVVGIVLGGTVVCVVALLVKQSFVGVRYRHPSLTV